MSTAVHLPAGRVLTVNALHPRARVEQVQDATVNAMVEAGTNTTFGPYELDRDFTITGPATVTTTEASLGADCLTPVAITASTAISRLHANRVLQVDSGSDVTLTLPADLPAGFSCLVDQVGAGKAIFAAASGATKANRQSFDRTAGQHALMSAYVRSNSDGASAAWVLGGDGAAA